MFWHASVLLSIHPSICLSTGGGVPISHNALQHFPECHGAAGGGVPCQVQPGGVPWLGGGYPARSSWGGTLPGPAGGVPWPGGVPWLGGYPDWRGTLAGGVPCPGSTLARGVPCRGGGTQLGNIGSTCYTAGGMPLAFTQEDFLVIL